MSDTDISSDTLPRISITPWLPNSKASPAEKAAVSKALHEACLVYGFFYLDISGFASKEETDELESLARRFFSLEQSVKDEISISKSDHARGYQRMYENVTLGKADSHEGLDAYAPVENPDPTRPLWGENQWPSDKVIQGFKSTYERWVERMNELGLIVMEAMAQGLGATTEEWEQLRAQVDHSFWVLRIIGYPPLPPNHDGISCGAHRDYGCLTFLYADKTEHALQVFRAGTELGLDGKRLPGQWIHADPIPGHVVVNIGEMWEIWTAGLYRSTLHRVIHRGTGYRISIPFFFEPNYEAIIKPIPAALRLLSSHTDPHSKENKENIPSSDIQGSGTDHEQAALVRKGRKRPEEYTPIKYGDFLVMKVTNNFKKAGAGGGGGGKYA